jgi:hypothetical protein
LAVLWTLLITVTIKNKILNIVNGIESTDVFTPAWGSSSTQRKEW